MAWPWMEMMTACVMFIGLVLSVFLLTGKFPASRFLGQLTIAYLVFIPIHILRLDTYWQALVVLFITISFNWYTSAFFTQNSRVKLSHVWAVACLLIATQGLSFLQYQRLSQILLWVVSLVFLINAFRKVKGEADNRGISWFQSPGQRLVWYRNFLVLELTSIVTLMIMTHQSYLWVINLIVGINFIYIYYQVFLESGFFNPLPVANKYKKSTLSASQKSAIVERLDKLVLESKFYLNDDASLSSLAEALHTSTHHLSQVLNESKGISFQELISQNRIREARRLLKDEDLQQTKVENIAAMVGYNSKSAFNTAFKRHTGMTPSEFRESKDVLTYREVPLPDRKKPNSPGSTISLSHLFTKKLKRNMVSNFFKTFIRTLNRNKVFTLINLLGLIVGFSSSLLIYLFIQDEMSYDRALPKSDRIYRINWLNDEPQTRTPHPMAQAMATDWPEVESAVSISPWYGSGLSKQTIKVKNEKNNILFEEPDFYFADSTFFNVFELKILMGDPDALRKTDLLVITKSMAEKYFGNENPIGQVLIVSDMPIQVATVVEDMPVNSHFHFNALIAYVTIKRFNPDNPWYTWADFGHFNYIKTKPGVDHKILESRIPEWALGYLDWSETNAEVLRSGEQRFELMPITDIHLHSHLRWELETNGNILYIYILTGTLIFLLVIAIINYVNLTTAKSVERAKEVGIKKTLGAVSGNLTFQFYLESILFSFIAVILAFGLAALLLDGFNNLSDKSFNSSDIFDLTFIGQALLISVAIGLLSGFYPALTLSSFRPAEVLKGKFGNSGQANQLRSVLVVAQFLVSAILIASSLIILRQIDYMKNKELGFDQEAVISLRIPKSVRDGGINIQTVKTVQTELRAIPGIKSVSAVSNLPGGQFNQNEIYAESDPDNSFGASEMQIDFDAIETLDLKIQKGRSFDPKFATDSAGVNFILNEAAIEALNLADPIGERIVWLDDEMRREGQVVGVVQDFHYKSLHKEIQPLIMQILPSDFNHMIVRLEGNDFGQTISRIKSVYQRFDSELPFEYHFLDQKIADLYQKEQRTLDIFSIFAMIAVFLACLGLLGIALAMLSQRVKEVGVRKILGASPLMIVQMIFLQFMKLIGIALILGLPIAYFLMQEWLNEFPYQVALGPMPFVWSAVLLLIVAISSVSIVVTKIAATNPVRALRYE